MASIERDKREDGEWVLTLALAFAYAPMFLVLGGIVMVFGPASAAPGSWGWLCPLFAGISLALSYRLRAIARKGGDPSARPFQLALRAINWTLVIALGVFVGVGGCFVSRIFFS